MSFEGVTINELSKMANVTVRTIRFYSDEGVMDEPAGRDRYARYTLRHYLQLHVAKTLKEQFYPLRVIREKIAKMSDQELEYMAGPIPPEIRARFSESADEVVVMAQRSLVLHGAPAEHVVHSRRPVISEKLYALTKNTDFETVDCAPVDFELDVEPQPVVKYANMHVSRRMSTKREQVMHAAPKELAHSMPTKSPIPIGEVWHRLTVKPGIELHISEDALQDSLGDIKRIIALLRKR